MSILSNTFKRFVAFEGCTLFYICSRLSTLNLVVFRTISRGLAERLVHYKANSPFLSPHIGVTARRSRCHMTPSSSP